MFKRTAGLIAILVTSTATAFSQAALITNIPSRKTTSLNGDWQYIIDPYETGFYDYRYKEREPSDNDAYWNPDIPLNKAHRKEYGYIDKYTIKVPGDWNHQRPEFLYYEGTVWYKKTFNFTKTKASDKVLLYFGAANYRTDVYLNGRKLGQHKGGFTPFNFEIPDSLLHPENNFLVVKVDNKRYADEVPTLNTDWWNYGGITRDVKLVEIPGASAIQDYFIQLDPAVTNSTAIKGWVKLNNASAGEKVTIEIPELRVKKEFIVKGNTAQVNIALPAFRRWSPEDPYRYKVIVSGQSDKVEEKIGFRTIRASGKQLLLNDKPVFLRGISIHEEIPQEMRRAHSGQDALQLLGWAKDLGCNMVRLAHYPHDENMTRTADSIGLLVWSEIPVYWTIDFTSKAVLEKAKGQLDEMLTRDHNRASIIIWSVGNETPVSEARTLFMKTLIATARTEDPTRLMSAALEVHYIPGQNLRSIDDPLGEYVDLVAFNEYLGWYSGTPESCRTAQWTTKYNKPIFISETGAEGAGGFHADTLTTWSEEYQEWYYKEQVAMLKRMPANFSGISPWILTDFRSPRRNNPTYQEGWNTKGLIDHNGNRKKAFYILKNYYREMKEQYK